MSEYKLTATDAVIRITDGAFIPNDPKNVDRQKYQTWLSAGNIPDPYVEDPEEAARKIRREAFDADTTRQELLAQLQASTPAQINTYVNNQVTDLASARTLLKKILLVISIV